IEWRLRYAQAEATLGDIRNLLLLRSLMFKSKDRYSRGQRQQTCSLALIARVEGRLKALAGKYCKIWKALKVLSTPLVNTSWCNVLRELEDADLDGMTLDDSGSEGRKKLSWIWKVLGTGADADEEAQTGVSLRIEWCRARARAHRWQEECLLLHEEMRRVLAFFAWQHQRWRVIANDLELQGKIAYAYRQASIREVMHLHCEREWSGLHGKLLDMGDLDATIMIDFH
ncbi:hypothetical protein BYT27DRAFT_7114203, partial [Phlegmacium glaucopus]